MKHRRKHRVRPRRKGRGGQVHVKAHTRTPRGPNAGKRIVTVPAYNRRIPRRGSAN